MDHQGKRSGVYGRCTKGARKSQFVGLAHLSYLLAPPMLAGPSADHVPTLAHARPISELGACLHYCLEVRSSLEANNAPKRVSSFKPTSLGHHSSLGMFNAPRHCRQSMQNMLPLIKTP